jgi:hypothetical protein
MPAQIFCYIRGLLQGAKPTTTSLGREFGYSHDSLTRFLKGRFAWKRWYVWVLQILFGSLEGGWLILDDTVLAKPFGKKFPRASVVWDSSKEGHVFGYNLVFLCWSNGDITIPLCWRWYKPNSQTKVDLALGLLREAKYVWRLRPSMVLFDAWYGAQIILNQLTCYQWNFVCRLRKNRLINGCRVEDDLIYHGDTLTGLLTGSCVVRVVKDDQRYLATSNQDLDTREILEWYARRWAIEECFRFLKSQLHLEKCQARTKTAQHTHLLTSIVSYLILQKEKQLHPDKTLYRLKEDWTFNKRLGYNRLRFYGKLLSPA